MSRRRPMSWSKRSPHPFLSSLHWLLPLSPYLSTRRREIKWQKITKTLCLASSHPSPYVFIYVWVWNFKGHHLAIAGQKRQYVTTRPIYATYVYGETKTETSCGFYLFFMEGFRLCFFTCGSSVAGRGILYRWSVNFWTFGGRQWENGEYHKVEKKSIRSNPHDFFLTLKSP